MNNKQRLDAYIPIAFESFFIMFVCDIISINEGKFII